MFSLFLSLLLYLYVLLQPCSKESIHQLVLNAENLVREEVFLQQQQQQLSSSRRHHSHPQKLNQNYRRQSSSSPVLLSVSPQSAKCNGASSNYRSDAATAVYMASTMKVNCTPTKKSASGSSPSSARKCDQLKIKLVQVRLGVDRSVRPLRKSLFFPLDWTLEDRSLTNKQIVLFRCAIRYNGNTYLG